MYAAIVKPTMEHLSDILGWLKEEEDSAGVGFYCNRQVISKCFADGRSRCIVEEGKVVAFGLYAVYGTESEILIMEVHPKRRRCGLGVALGEHLFALLKELGAESVNVECNPEESESFWRARGFITYIDEQNERNLYDPVELQKLLH